MHAGSTDAELLETWERGLAAGPVGRGLLLLAVAVPGRGAAALAGLPVGRRDRAVLDLRERLFGPRVEAVVECPGCRARLEVECTVEDLRSPAADDAEFDVDAGGTVLRVRPPTSLDLLHAAACPSVGRARRVLFERCARPAEGIELPDEAAEVVARALAAADPQADLSLDLNCPECGADGAVPFDAVAFVWRELDAWARRTVREVHALAAAYGWTEAEVLALPPRRRRVYLDLVTG